MKKLVLIISLWLTSAAAFAQIATPVKWAYAAKKVSSTEAVVFFKATIDDGWHIYSQHVKEGGPVATEFAFAPSKEYTLVGAPAEGTPLTKYESVFKMNVSYFEKSVIFQQKIKLKSPAATVVKGKFTYMTCNNRQCLPPEDVNFSIPVAR